MPAPLVWTPHRDRVLCSLRARGLSWEAIAAALGISRWSAIQRGRAVGARKPPAPPRPQAAPDPDREPLEPGHPASWGAITAGTMFAGQPYPSPPPGPEPEEEEPEEAPEAAA